MSNKSINQYSLQTNPASSDLVLFQRGQEYYSMTHQNFMMGIQRVVATLTQAQLQAINTTPVTLVSAQGSGTVIDPLECVMFYDHNGTNYTSLTNLRLKHSGNSNLIMGTSTSFMASASDRYEKLVMQTINATNQQQFSNTALVVDGNANASGNGGTVTVDLLYVIKKFS